jgi:glycosyltransferase involved in cell wall biosynthesis
MASPSSSRICIVPSLSGVGGMVSFQGRLARGLKQRGVQVTYHLDDTPYQSVLVVGGTRQLAGLWRLRRRGVRIVQRLDGMNWLQRVQRTGAAHFVRAEMGNLLLAFIRSRLAHAIVYQSRFSREWWERRRGPLSKPCSVVYNGVDLDQFTPDGPGDPPDGVYRLLLVEGSLMGGYEQGLEAAEALAYRISSRLGEIAPANPTTQKIELMIVGRVAPDVRQRWQAQARIPLHWAGLQPQESIPAIDRSAHLLYSSDINAACPNSVIEALACGLPVAAFATGALPELVPPAAGCVIPYGGDPWRLDPPDIDGLAGAALQVLAGLPAYRRGARQIAEVKFNLEHMLDGYLEALLEG